MRKNIRIIIILVLMVVLLVFASLIINLNKSIKAKELENTNKTDAHIASAIEDSIKLLSVEGDYEEIITTKKTWVLGLNPSIAWVKVKGTIKVGSNVLDAGKKGSKYIIKLSEPEIISHEINPEGLWNTEEGFLNHFDAASDGKIIEESKKIIEKEKFNELKQRCIENNKQIIQSCLKAYGKNYDIEIDYEKK